MRAFEIPQQTPENWTRSAVDVLAALIIYVSTLYFAPHAIFVVGAALLVLNHGVKLQQRDLLLGVFVVGALLNVFFHSGGTPLSGSISSMGTPLIALTVMAGRNLSRRFLFTIVLLTIVEIAFGLFEFSTQRIAINSAHAAVASRDMISTSELLYGRSVLGLSANSSEFAEKIFIAVLILYGYTVGKRLKLALMALLFAGLYITFNRTAIIATVLYFLVIFFMWAIKSPRRMPLAVVVGLAALGVCAVYLQPIIDQFTRGTGSVTYSELARLYYGQAALQDLMASPLMGNGSLNWTVLDPFGGTLQHAHNSLLMLLVKHGLLLGTVFIVFILLGTNRRYIIPLGVMLLFSITQYFFFWNMSLADLLLHHFTRFGREANAFKRRETGMAMPWRRGRHDLPNLPRPTNRSTR